MEQLLKPVENPDSVFIYRDDQKFTCTDYDKLAEFLTESLFESERNERFMTDLRYSSSHPLMFEFSVVNETGKNTYDFWRRFVDFMFIRTLRKFISLLDINLLITMSKSKTKGLRIYVCDVEISHDDYLHLCDLIMDDCYYREGDLIAHLDVKSIFPLPSCDTEDLHVPVHLIDIQLGFHEDNGIWYPYRQEIIPLDHVDKTTLVRDMMPISQGKNMTHVHFPTDIFHESFLGNTRLGKEYVATFKSYFNHEIYYILRNSNYLVEGKGFCYNFLKKYANNIYLVKNYGEENILDFWYKLLYQHSPLVDTPFAHLDQILKRQCPHLSNEPSPLKAVLLKYERPVYYALCNILKNEVDVDEIRKHFPFISKDLPTEPPKEAKDLNFNTILYCADMTGEGTILDHLGVLFDYIAKNINSVDQLKKHVMLMQERIFPVISNPKSMYIWDPFVNKWNATANRLAVPEIENVVRDIIHILNSYYKLPTELIDLLFNNRLKMDLLIHSIIYGPQGREYTFGNTTTELYDHNVPEYYFLDFTTEEKTTSKDDSTTTDEKTTDILTTTKEIKTDILTTAKEKTTDILTTTEEKTIDNDILTIVKDKTTSKDDSITTEEKTTGKDILITAEEKTTGKDILITAEEKTTNEDNLTPAEEKTTSENKLIASPALEEKTTDTLIVPQPAKEEKINEIDDGKDKSTVSSEEKAKEIGGDKATIVVLIESPATKEKEKPDKNKLNIPIFESSIQDEDKSTFRIPNKESSRHRRPSLTHSSHYHVPRKQPSLTHSSHYHAPRKEQSLTHRHRN